MAVCFEGEVGKQIRNSSHEDAVAVVNELQKLNGRLAKPMARLPKIVLKRLSSGDFGGIWDLPSQTIFIDDRVFSRDRPEQQLIAGKRDAVIDVAVHEFGHAIFDSLSSDQREKFKGYYDTERRNPRVFVYETDENYGSYGGHPEDDEHETFASLTIIMWFTDARLHSVMNPGNRQVPESIKQLIRPKHEFIHQVIRL